MKKESKLVRCHWANPQNERYLNYHDQEWGIPLYDDQKLAELLILESFQAGLSWECVLNKREAFRKAFDQFDLDKLCHYDDCKVEELLQNKDIIRNKLKIKAAITNARIIKQIQAEAGSLSNYLWSYTDNKIVYELGKSTSPLSDKISLDLKRRGMKFVGSTIIYAYLQAMGMINSHEKDCFLYQSIKKNIIKEKENL